MSSSIATHSDGPIMFITLPSLLDAEVTQNMNSLMQGWLIDNAEYYVFDFKSVSEIKIQYYSTFVRFAQLVKKAKKKIASLNLNDDIQTELRGAGIIQSFNPQKSLAEVKSFFDMPNDKKDSKITADVSVINPFIAATTKTLDVQARTKSTPGKPFLLKVEEKNYEPPIGIVGVVTVSTSKFHGSIALVFPENVFLHIYENMFGEKHDKITSEIEDAAGEILNIIYGVAKVEINQQPGMNLKPALPTILSGEKINIRQRTSEKIIILPFKTEVGEFQLEIALETNS